MKAVIPAAILAALILSIFALYPQYNLQNLRGEDYSGAFATYDLDEMAYASYLQALIDGRPRKNDPYTGRDHTAADPQPESLFSIQSATAYFIALPARIFGLNGWQVMPLISFLSAFLTAVTLFWLIYSFTEDIWLTFAGTIAVISGGSLISGIGAFSGLFEGGINYPFPPYLRRHIPSLSFPFLFAFLGCLWNGLKAEEFRRQIIYSILSSACFGVLVFSYFYLWTTAAAILCCLAVSIAALTLIERSSVKKDLKFVAITSAMCFMALIPYGYLLSKRNEMMDKAQLMVYTRQPDLFRQIEIIGIILLAAVFIWLILKRPTGGLKKAAYFMALAASPLIVFNQQVLTGRSLQPFHYEYYSANYVVMLAVAVGAILAAGYISKERKVSKLIFAVFMAFTVICWAGYETYSTAKFWDNINIVRDEAMPVNLRLRELAGADPAAATKIKTVNLEPLQADSQPTVAPQAVLWARHQHTFVGVENWEENKRRYYTLLYYSDYDAAWLERSLTRCSNIEACMALFGWDRFNSTLSANARPLTKQEIIDEAAVYRQFVEDFDKATVDEYPLAFLVFRTRDNEKLENLQKWYDLSAKEELGEYQLYKLTAK